MDFFDIINRLRKGEPDIKKAGKAMKILGWICVAGALWNYAFYYLGPFDETPFNLPPSYPYVALTTLILLGCLFLYSAKAINEMDKIGKRAGQLAIILLFVLLAGFMYIIYINNKIFAPGDEFSIVFVIFSVVFLLQFGLPSYYGIRYLGRLPTVESRFQEGRFSPEVMTRVLQVGKSADHSLLEIEFKEALFPFGVLGTFLLFLAVPLIMFFVVGRFGTPEQMTLMFLPLFLFIFLAPVTYNFFPSSFQKSRNNIASFTGGGSIFLFSGTWPFFRLLIYRDGLEVRAMFHRFFIPYDKMEDLPEKIGFFSRGILIKSNLPGVPSGIRYKGICLERVLAAINQNRERFRNGEQPAM